MTTKFAILTIVIAIGSLTQYANAEGIPSWIKNNAGWWADDMITSSEFVQGIQFLISEKILIIPSTPSSEKPSEEIPDWIKHNAGWWADGVITDEEFVNGIQHLIQTGVIQIPYELSEIKSMDPTDQNPELKTFESKLNECDAIKNAYDRLNCEKEIKAKITSLEYKITSQVYQIGPVDFYYPGAELEISGSGQALLTIKMLVENTNSDGNVSLFCSGPAVCNYDVSDGSKVFKYSSTDFTNGQIVLPPGKSREMTILFGPNIGYGGTKFEYDPTKEYFFRVSEPWGNGNIPLKIGSS